MKEVIERYKLYAKAQGFSDHYIDHVCRAVRFLDEYLGGTKTISEVTENDFRSFLVSLVDRLRWGGKKGGNERKLSGTSRNTYARAIKAFFSWAKSDGVIIVNPLEKVRSPKKPKIIPKVYKESELYSIFEAVADNLRNKAILFLLLDSGIRLAELAFLRIMDVDTQTGTIKVFGKGGKERYAYFSQLTAAILDSYAKTHRSNAKFKDSFFITNKGSSLSANGIQSLLARIGRKAGVCERLAPHKLRHTFATLSLKYGGNLEYIRKILGHSDIKTTSDSYLNVSDEHVIAGYKKFSPLSNLKMIKEYGSQPEVDASKSTPEALKEVSGEKGRLVKPKPVSPYESRPDRSTDKNVVKEIGKRFNQINSWGMSLIFEELFREHLKKLIELLKELIVDIENDRIEEPKVTVEANVKIPFGDLNLARVFCTQNKSLWPFLLVHLNNEFSDPPLGTQIDRIATLSFWGKYIGKKLIDPNLVEQVTQNLLLVRERGIVKGTCRICKEYFVQKDLQ